MKRADRCLPCGPLGKLTAASAAVDGGDAETTVVVVTPALPWKLLPRIAGGPVGAGAGGTVAAVVGGAEVGVVVPGAGAFVTGGTYEVAGGDVTGGRVVGGGG